MVGTLVNTFFERDPYYPRPVPDNELYKAFKAGYMEGCPQGPDLEYAKAFLVGIEGKYAAEELMKSK